MNETTLTRQGPMAKLLARVDGRYRYPARRFVEFVEKTGKPLGDPATWDEYLASLKRVQTEGKMAKRRYSAGSYNVRLAAMKAILKAALQDETAGISDVQARVVRDRLDELKSKKKPAPSTYIPEKLMTAAEVQMLMRRVQLPNWDLPGNQDRKAHPDIALMLEFLWQTGVRVSEMTGVLLTDLSRTNNHYSIRIMGKGAKERIVSVTVDLVKRITDHFKGDTYLFQSRNGGKGMEPDYRYSRTYVSQEIHRVGWTLLHRKISAHALRHSALTHYYEATRDLERTRQFAGHSSSATTAAYYLHVGNDPVETLGIMALSNGQNREDAAGACSAR